MDVPNIAQIDDIALRHLAAACCTELNARGLDRRTSRWRRLFPDNAEWRMVKKAAQAFKTPIDDFCARLADMRVQIGYTTLSSRDNASATLAKVEDAVLYNNKHAFIFSNGTAFCSNVRRWHNRNTLPSKGEYVLVEPNKPFVYANMFFRIFGEEFVQQYRMLQTLPNKTVFRIILNTAGSTDTPQEAFVTWCLKAIRVSLDTRLMLNMEAVLMGYKKAPDILIRDLIVPFLLKSTKTPASDPISYSDLFKAPYSNTPNVPDEILRACERVLINCNLLAGDLTTDRTLNIPLKKAYREYMRQEKRASKRAKHLRTAVAKRFGFKETMYHNEPAWERSNKHHKVVITNGLRVLIDGSYRCVVEGQSTALPHDDQIVRRMLTVATNHRDRITTFQNDLPVLESLFADYKHAKIWDLAD